MKYERHYHYQRVRKFRSPVAIEILKFLATFKKDPDSGKPEDLVIFFEAGNKSQASRIYNAMKEINKIEGRHIATAFVSKKYGEAVITPIITKPITKLKRYYND